MAKAKNYVLGAGKIYFDLLNAVDEVTGERYIGNTPGFSLTVASETLDHFDNDSGVRELDAQALLQTDRDGTIQVDDIDTDNQAAFIIGTKSTKSQGVATVTDEILGHAVDGVKLDHWYQLGATATDPSGVRNVTAVTLDGSGGTPTYVLNTDYELDAALGRIKILSTGAIVGGASPEANYTTAAETWDHIESSSTAIQYAAVRFVADNREGENRDLYIPKALLAPEGEWQLKGDEWQTMSYAVKAQKRGVLAAVIIDGRPA